jgi:lysophospholipase L1-like esterase
VGAAKRILFYAVMWSATAVVIVAGIELILPRFAPTQHISHHRWGNRPPTLLPGVTHRATTRNYDVTFRANALGFNDVEHSLAKPPGRFRVLLLGDSFVEGFQVRPERHLARLLEGLAARDGHDVEVVAMGISGYGQAQELATYESVGRPYRPDLVVAFFCPNDLWNNLVGIEGDEGPPVYTLSSEGKLVSSFAGQPETPVTPAELRKHVRQPRFPGLREVRHLVRVAYRLVTNSEMRGAARAVALQELPRGRRQMDPQLPRGIRADQQLMFASLVAEMKREVVERDGTPLLSVIVSGNASREPGRAYRRMIRWVTNTFARQGIETLNLDTLFRDRSRREQRYPSWPTDLHWNETGHAWVAETLYARIEPLLDSPSSDAPPSPGRS